MSGTEGEPPGELPSVQANKPQQRSRPVWHRDPKLKPNYGPTKPLLPKSSIKQVVLYSNMNEDRKLAKEKESIQLEEKWCKQVFAVQRKSFAVRQILQEQYLQSKGIKVINILPPGLKAEFKHHAMFHNMSKYGAKDLPMWHRLDKHGLMSTQAKFTTAELQKEAEQKAKDDQFRRTLAMGGAAERDTPGTAASWSSSRSSSAASGGEEQRHPVKLPAIGAVKKSVTVTGIPLKSRPYSTYNAQVMKERTATYGRPVHREKSVVDPRFVRLSQSLSAWDVSGCHDPFLLLSESSWGDREKLTKADADFIHKKYMPSSCTHKKIGSDSTILFPKAMTLIQRYKKAEDDSNLE